MKNNTTLIQTNNNSDKINSGVEWLLNHSDNKTIWVCNTNIIAENTYKLLLNKLKQLKIKKTVELHLTYKTKNTNNKNFITAFTSDIIITNIDDYLTYCINNYANQYNTKCYNVIFDESNDYINEQSIFAGFIDIMIDRNTNKNRRNTLLLNTTPLLINYLWDTIKHKTKIITKYNNINNKTEFKVNFIDDENELINKKGS